MQGNKWFTQESMMRRVSQEALGLLGAGRAILLQLAHPLVSAGVAEYSDFQADPLSRLFHTLELMHRIVFGNPQQAKQALAQFHSMHARIQGRLPEAVGRFPAGTAYVGNDPQLKLWVFATLIDTSLDTYERFVAPLAEDERHHFYEDAEVMGELLGIQKAIFPPTLDDFHVYMGDMLAGDTLVVSDTARQVAHSVLYPNVGLIPTGSALLMRFVTAGILPQRFREAYNLPWNGQRQLLLGMLSHSTRLLRPVVPASVWQSPLLGGRLPRWLLWQIAET